jgi:hypothetical protein
MATDEDRTHGGEGCRESHRRCLCDHLGNPALLEAIRTGFSSSRCPSVAIRVHLWFASPMAQLHGSVHPDFWPVARRLTKQLGRGPGGAAVCVYHRGEKVVDIWGGVRDAAGTPWTADTMSVSFSTTKGVTATALHILVDRGLLDYAIPSPGTGPSSPRPATSGSPSPISSAIRRGSTASAAWSTTYRDEGGRWLLKAHSRRARVGFWRVPDSARLGQLPLGGRTTSMARYGV